MTEPTINTDADLLAVLRKISFTNSVLDFKWGFRFRQIKLPAALDQSTNSTVEDKEGWLIWAEFERPDINTGVLGVGRGRDEIILKGMSLSGVVKTCWVLFEMLVRHEMMEAFQYDGVRIFNPHHTVAELSMPARVQRVKDEIASHGGFKALEQKIMEEFPPNKPAEACENDTMSV